MSADSPRELPDLRAGLYRHYKGPLYQVLGYAHDANDADRVVVLYFPLELDGAHEGPRLAVRTVEDFFAMVTPEGVLWREHEDALKDAGGHCACEAVWRFEYVGSQFYRGYQT